jgi:hypothetical protein
MPTAQVSRESSTNAGALAASAWLWARGLRPPAKTWDVEIGLDVTSQPATLAFEPKLATRFQLHIYAEEWGFRFCHDGHESWIRVTDIPFVHGSDYHRLLAATPPLKGIAAFLRMLESRHAVTFQRRHAAIASMIPDSEAAIRTWVQTL